jgi:pimeloyl-ACP methyl ester carboxylesterase
MARIDTVILVHGAFVDGSGWAGVHAILTNEGFKVVVAQLPAQSLLGDAATVRTWVNALKEPCILVGHGYGGAVITEVGIHPRVAGLVYVAAFAPDKGESVASLTAEPTPGHTPPPYRPPVAGLMFLDAAEMPATFAADVDPATAAFMAAAQVGWGMAAWTGVIGEAAWRHKPSWYLRTTDDRIIPLPAQVAMSERIGATVSETSGNHAIYISSPQAVAAVIRAAADGAAKD